MLYATGFFLNRIYCHPHEELKGETACWGHYFNDFIGVLLLLPLIGWTSIETCIGKNCKLGLFFCSKSLVNCLNFKFVVRGGVEDTRLEAKDTKKLSGPRTGPLEAKARPSLGQGHRRKCSPKKGLQNNFSGDLSKLRSSKIFFRQTTKFQQFKK